MEKIAGPTDISMTLSYNLQITVRSSATVMAKLSWSIRARYTKCPAVTLRNTSIKIQIFAGNVRSKIPFLCRYKTIHVIRARPWRTSKTPESTFFATNMNRPWRSFSCPSSL